MGGSVRGVLDPRAWLASLRTLGASYAVAALAFYLALFAEVVVIGATRGGDGGVLVIGIAKLVLYLSMALRARLLAALCEPYFARRPVA